MIEPSPTGPAGRSFRAALWAVACAAACSSAGRGTKAPEGAATQMQAEAYVARAIRSSPEGFILFPSVRAERVYERPALQRIAQTLRPQAAACFANRAIETLQRREAPGGVVYEHAPEGQAKIRVRIGPDGAVLRSEILESGFEDEGMESCLLQILDRVRWPPNRQGHVHYVDVVYWVSLGPNKFAHTKILRDRIRREQAAAAIRGKKCLRGRVPPGRYPVDATVLLDRDGRTIAARLDTHRLPEKAAHCLVAAVETVRGPADPASFVRPVGVHLGFTVTTDGAVAADDEDWLALLRAEERARARARRAEREGLDLHGRAPRPAAPTSVVGASPATGPAGGTAASTEATGATGVEPTPEATPAGDTATTAAPAKPADPPPTGGPLPLSGLRGRRAAPAKPPHGP